MDRDVERMVADMEVRGLSARTRRIYRRQVERFAAHFDRPPGALGADEIAAYFLHLTRERGLCAASRNQTASALRFFFETTLRAPERAEALPLAKVTKPLPVVLSADEVARLLAAFRSSKHRAIGSLCCGAGLRVSEACELELADIDSARDLLRIRGKGDKCARCRSGRASCASCARTGASTGRRGRCSSRRHGTRRAPSRAARFGARSRRRPARAGIAKHVSAHVLRHSYATHLVEAGADLRSAAQPAPPRTNSSSSRRGAIARSSPSASPARFGAPRSSRCGSRIRFVPAGLEVLVRGDKSDRPREGRLSERRDRNAVLRPGREGRARASLASSGGARTRAPRTTPRSAPTGSDGRRALLRAGRARQRSRVRDELERDELAGALERARICAAIAEDDRTGVRGVIAVVH